MPRMGAKRVGSARVWEGKVGDVTIKGWVLRETPSGLAWVFMADDRLTAAETVCLPKSLVAVVKGVMGDEVTIPSWLAIQKGLR